MKKEILFFKLIFLLLFRNKLHIDYEDRIIFDNLEKQLADIQISINELEAWHTRTSNSKQKKRDFSFQILFHLF